MALDQDNKELMDVAVRAFELASERGHEMVTLEHLLAALLETPNVQKCFSALKLEIQPIADLMQTFLDGDYIEKTTRQLPVQSVDFEILFRRVVNTAQFNGSKTPPGVNDVLLNLMQMIHEDSFALTALHRSGITPLMLKKYLAHGTGAAKPGPGPGPGRGRPDMYGEGMGGSSDAEPTTREEALEILGKYCVDLNALAAAGKIDPVIGRVDIIDQINVIVSRRTKNNAVLVGDPGVGKTAIAEGLAYKIFHKDVPAVLQNSTVYNLDVASLVAGTRFRGDFEERMKVVLKALILVEDSILFIDEIHTIIGAGSGSGSSMDVGNLLKPALGKGKLRCIGSTTLEEYRKHFEKDRALLRRFKKILVEEPSIPDAKLILRGLRDVFAEFHSVVYSDEALDAAVDLTARYVHGQVLPDKAIDVMDNAGARQRVLANAAPGTVVGLEDRPVVRLADIEFEVAKVAKIPAQEVAEDEAKLLRRLEGDLKSAVFGQDNALEALRNAVFVSRAGLRSPNKPAGAYLFTGPTGVGKTETARALAKTLNIPLIKFDMSEYMEKHAVAKLIGSPPGYVGFGEGGAGDGLLINAIDTNPSCVLLLDEIEKAHPDLFNIFLQVMDDSKLTSSQGKEVPFQNVILIMTSNAGSRVAEKVIGFGRETEVGAVDDSVVKKLFSPEFRNRLDDTINFNRLQPASMERIVVKFVDQLRVLASLRNVNIDINKKALNWLAAKGFDPMMGARPLERVIHENIKKPLSALMLIGDLSTTDAAVKKTAVIRVVGDMLSVTGKLETA